MPEKILCYHRADGGVCEDCWEAARRDTEASWRARLDQVKAKQEDLAAEFERLSADLYEQMHEIKRISEESVKAFDHHVTLLKRAKRIEDRLKSL